MASTNSLSHLSEEDKREILSEIHFFLSPKGFIDGIALYERMESVLGIKGELTTDHKLQMKAERRNYGKLH